MLRAVLLSFFASVGLLGCVTLVQEAPIEVTPGAVPKEVQGASWPEQPIEYCIVRDEQGGFVDHDTFARITQDAVAVWPVSTTYAGECTGLIEPGNGTNEIGWGDLGDGAANLSEAGNTNIRYRTTLSGGPPDIIEADITIAREAASGRASEECLFTTLVHEAGHLLGVPHLEQGTIMSPVITDCLQELTPGDIAAIDELY